MGAILCSSLKEATQKAKEVGREFIDDWGLIDESDDGIEIIIYKIYKTIKVREKKG
jgi:hypothetical protein